MDKEDDQASVEFVDLGSPVSGVEIRICRGRDVVQEGVIGSFHIRGSVVTPGYLNNDAANADSFVGDGWFDSGDLGFFSGGRLVLTGRAKEQINIRGSNLFCYEVEAVVQQVAGVLETFVAATSYFDAELGTERLVVVFAPQNELILLTNGGASDVLASLVN